MGAHTVGLTRTRQKTARKLFVQGVKGITMGAIDVTPKQERYAQNRVAMIVKGEGTKTDAYKDAYNTENMTDKTANEEASRTDSNSKVSARIKELLAQCHINQITPELIEQMLLNEAMNAQSDGARVNAIKTMAQVKAMLIEAKMDVNRTMTDDEIIEQIAGDNDAIACQLRAMLGKK